MFDTLHDGIKANVDSKLLDNNEIIVKGWSFSESQGVCPVRCRYDSYIRSANIEARQDITAKFNRNNIILCGWKFTVPVNKYIDLQIKIDNEWSTFISFNTFNIYDTNNDIINDKVDEITSVITDELTTTKLDIIDVSTDTDMDTDTNTTIQQQSNDVVSVINFSRNSNNLSNIYIVDNFYEDPDNVRKTAIETFEYNEINNVTKNMSSFKEHIEKIIGANLDNFQKYDDNGQFKFSTAGDKIEFMTKSHTYNAIIFLTPNAPINTGITLYKSLHTNKQTVDENENDIVFKNGNLDSTEFVPIDIIGNVYNRIVIFNASQIHAITNHFGKDIHTGRLVQVFSFDIQS